MKMDLSFGSEGPKIIYENIKVGLHQNMSASAKIQIKLQAWIIYGIMTRFSKSSCIYCHKRIIYFSYGMLENKNKQKASIQKS